MDMTQLRAMRKSANTSLQKISEALESTVNKNYTDERLWSFTKDKSGNAKAVIRFLPGIDEELPWVKRYHHAFQGPSGKWYIENCRTTIGKDDPVVEHVSSLFDSGRESDKEIGRQRKRKVNYFSNILVVDDPMCPENNGKVMVFKYGKVIFDMINGKLHPTFDDETPCNVFDPWEGANFRLKGHMEDGYLKYSKSTWDGPSEIAESDEEILEILNKRHNISDYVSEKEFKSYDALKKRMDIVLGKSNKLSPAQNEISSENEIVHERKEAIPKEKKEATNPQINEDEDMAFFNSLIDEMNN